MCLASAAAVRLLFAEALQQGTMTGFFKLVEQYRYVQYLGVSAAAAAAAAVLVATSIDPASSAVLESSAPMLE